MSTETRVAATSERAVPRRGRRWAAALCATLAIGAVTGLGAPDAGAATLPYRAYALLGNFGDPTMYGFMVDSLGPLGNLEVTRFEGGQPVCTARMSLRLGEFNINPLLTSATLKLDRPAPCTQSISRVTVQWTATGNPEVVVPSLCRTASATTSIGLLSPAAWMCIP